VRGAAGGPFSAILAGSIGKYVKSAILIVGKYVRFFKLYKYE
jgi:hypothetical protein